MKNDFNLLKLFEKYHANFKDCKLNFDYMVNQDHIPSFNFLKDHGCRFQNMEESTHFGYSHDSTINFPLGRLVSQFCFLQYSDPSTIIFMMDFSSPEQILGAKSNGMNLIDIFMNCNLPDGIIKAYKLCNSIFYPLSKDKDEYLKWVNETHNLELIKLFY